VNYSIKTLSQLPLILKGFRKARGWTQAAMAEKLGITQQSYAYFEANPATATLERLFTVLRLLDVEIGLAQDVSVEAKTKKIDKTAQGTAKVSKTSMPGRITPGKQKKESW
jgi:HTH-type transcriptional regulator/antitoxin HipB